MATVTEWVKKNVQPTLEELSSFPNTLKIYAEKFASLEIIEEILGVVDLEDLNSFALAVPQSLGDELLTQFHEGMGTAHEGAKKVLSRISRSYFWPHMNRNVKPFVSSSAVCDKFRGRRKNPRHPLHPIPVGSGGEVLAMDLVGGKENLLTTPRGFKYILLMIDLFTRFVVAVPIPDMSVQTVVDAVLMN